MPVHHLNYERKQSCNQGHIVPIGIKEVLPGDNIRHKITALVRTQPLLAPIYHSAEVKIHTFFVPFRLIWEDWEKFITGGPDGLDSSTPPTIDFSGGISSGTLADYMTVPLDVNEAVSALPFRAYSLIYNEYFRDQDLINPVTIDLTSGVDSTTNTSLLRAAWNKDYFTTARADTQKGDDVEISLTGDAPVTGLGFRDNSTFSTSENVYETDDSGTVNYSSYKDGASTNQGIAFEEDPNNSGFPNIRADLSNVSSVSINDLRLSVRLQHYKENMLQYGSRYSERLAHAFGVKNQDARLDRPELLASGKNIIQFSEVLQTGPSNDDSSAESVADLKGHGINVTNSNRYKRFIPEYGFIISLMTIRPKTAYQDGLPRLFSRTTKEMYYHPELDGIGKQIIKNKEVRAAHATPDGTFGFNNRYDEYRYVFDEVAGEFRDTLDFWHMGRKFSSDPALNQSFVECEGVDRGFATSADEFLVRAMHKLSMKRKVSAVGNPTVF